MCELCAPFKGLAMDRKTPRNPVFARARQAENTYAKQLRKISRHIEDVTRAVYDPDDPTSSSVLTNLLRRYSETIAPWAEAVGTRMVAEVNARDLRAWNAASRQIGAALRQEIDSGPTGLVMRARLKEQITLIKSLPLDAAERVHKLTLDGITKGTRASEIAKEIAASGEVSKARANMIARTEVSRTATELTSARAQYVGSPGYFWRTSKDTDVRKSHAEMEGKFVPWGEPPTIDGMTGHAGAFPNCRCWPDPSIPD